MSVSRPIRTARLVLAAVCCLGLLAPVGAAVRAAGPGTGTAAVLGGSPDGLGQALLRDRVLGPLLAPGAKRDDRDRPGVDNAFHPAQRSATLPHRGTRPGTPGLERGSPATAAAGARAPPSLQPAPI
jgi:hypothetical protein